jgi:hypothetical protein
MKRVNPFRPSLYLSLQVLMPDTALAPGSPSPLAQAISRFDCDIVMTAANRGAFNDAEGIERVQKLAVVDHLNILVLIEQKSVISLIIPLIELNLCLISPHPLP